MLQIPLIEEPRLLAPPVSKNEYILNMMRNVRANVILYLVILLAGFFLSQILYSFIPKKDASESLYREVPRVPVQDATPSAVPVQSPVVFAPVSDYLLTFTDYSQFDSVTELHLIQKSTGLEKTLGNVSAYGSLTSSTILSYPPRVVFLRESGGAKNEEYNALGSALVVYSIASDTFVSTLTLADIKSRNPNLDIPRNASLNTLQVSPSGNRVAFNYGYAIEPDYGSDIFVVNLLNGKVTVIGEKGKLKQWVNDVILRYESIDSTRSTQSLDSLSSKVSRDVGVPY